MSLTTVKTEKHIRQLLALAILIFINSLFIYKYWGRVMAHPEIPTILVACLQIGVFVWQSRIVWKVPFLILVALPIVFWVSVIAYAHFSIPLQSLNIDRWSVIDSFLTAWESGAYPYYATSHLGNPPGPMPIYFLLAYPFAKLGELSLFALVGYVIVFYWVVKKATNHVIAPWFLLLSSIFAVYELMVRSNVFTNSALVLLLMHFIEKNGIRIDFKGILLALLTGFLLSTRSIFSMVYVVFFVSYLVSGKTKFTDMLVFGTIAVLAFGLTFVPLLLRFPHDFFVMNPFIVQSTFLIPLGYSAAFFLIALILGLLSRSRQDRFFYSAMSLFVPIAVYFAYLLYHNGFKTAFTNGMADISYFIMCAPFFLYFLAMREQLSE